MKNSDEEKRQIVRDYHERTKHHLNRGAASLGYMDWANQPNPFRRFDGSEKIHLPHPDIRETPTYDALFSGSQAVVPLGAELVGRLFYHSLALSAWKKAPYTDPWSLRINPSSGALHPTEGYLISGPVPGLIEDPGVFHYAPYFHHLERRCRLSPVDWEALTASFPSPCVLVALTSIYWRESWKYGERAFRYCNHDVGHAIGAMTFAARTLGWEMGMVESMNDADLDHLLGIHLQNGIESEHADGLFVVFPEGAGKGLKGPPVVMFGEDVKFIPDSGFTGEPNRLSREHHPWPIIDEVSRATRMDHPPGSLSQEDKTESGPLPPDLFPERKASAEQIIRQRRSAVQMDGQTSMGRNVFYQMLLRLGPSQFLGRSLSWTPKVSLVFMVHRVDDLVPGIYLLVRDASHDRSLRGALNPDFKWQRPEGCPPELNLYRLLADDVREAAKEVSCHQDIASDGIFMVAMLAEFEILLQQEGAHWYPRVYWETGLIGQVLYLEAEAAGIRGTGIGCFFDDVMHSLLGIKDASWQSLYHFTVGGPLDDARLGTIAPYAHLDESGNGD